MNVAFKSMQIFHPFKQLVEATSGPAQAMQVYTASSGMNPFQYNASVEPRLKARPHIITPVISEKASTVLIQKCYPQMQKVMQGDCSASSWFVCLFFTSDILYGSGLLPSPCCLALLCTVFNQVLYAALTTERWPINKQTNVSMELRVMLPRGLGCNIFN